ncbi:MAG: hypothetical protein ACLPKB_32060 [Xanthobacteraceae bacterium]
MTVVPLRLGPLNAEGHDVFRSGIRWLCHDGQFCGSGEVLGYCNIQLRPRGNRVGPEPFREEARDFQVALVTRRRGRFKWDADRSHGGWLDRQVMFGELWLPDTLIGSLECEASERLPAGDPNGLSLLFVAGRRVSELAEIRIGLLSGWHDRSRAWWGDNEGPMGTVLSLGLCDLIGVIRGDGRPFAEFLGSVRGPAHAVYLAHEAVLPCALIVKEQAHRTPADAKAIADDLSRSLHSDRAGLTPADWLFAGCLLGSLEQSPLTDGFDILRRSGLDRAGPPDAIVMSLNAEPATYLRHRRKGYALHIAEHRVMDAGPAIRNWLLSDFEIVRRSIDDIRADYETLFRIRPETAFLIMNVVSTTGHEDIVNYSPFDHPMGDTLSYIRAKELNLMLHDLARDNNVSIVDVDAIAADMGIALHIPDGLHPSGPMEAELRGAILHALRERRIPGFTHSVVT